MTEMEGLSPDPEMVVDGQSDQETIHDGAAATRTSPHRLGLGVIPSITLPNDVEMSMARFPELYDELR